MSKKGYLCQLKLGVIGSSPELGGQKAPTTLRELPLTCLSQPTKGTSGKTGFWRTFRPVFDKGKCTKCLLCWVYCPEAAVSRNEMDYPVIDFDYCKGCGICAFECRTKALTMRRESG